MHGPMASVQPVLPELMRSLRHLGAPLPDPHHQQVHDRWFAPLLDARSAVQGISDAPAQIAAIGADTLRSNYEAVMAAIARSQVPDTMPAQAPRQRALEARIEEAAAAVFVALEAQRAVEREAMPDRTNASGWTDRWIDALRTTCAAIDAAFPQVLHTVATWRAQ